MQKPRDRWADLIDVVDAEEEGISTPRLSEQRLQEHELSRPQFVHTCGKPIEDRLVETPPVTNDLPKEMSKRRFKIRNKKLDPYAFRSDSTVSTYADSTYTSNDDYGDDWGASHMLQNLNAHDACNSQKDQGPVIPAFQAPHCASIDDFCDIDACDYHETSEFGDGFHPEPTPYTEVDLANFEGCIPVDEKGMATSIGSINHASGGCNPCLFMLTNDGCSNGILCNFCHFQHKRKTKPRPCKGKRDRYRKLVVKIEAMIEENPWEWHSNLEDLPPSIVENPALKQKLMSKLMAFAESVKAQGQNATFVQSKYPLHQTCETHVSQHSVVQDGVCPQSPYVASNDGAMISKRSSGYRSI